MIDNVWVCSTNLWASLATALRHQLILLHRARASADNRNGKLQALYGYLVGSEFRNRVELMVQTFVCMSEQLKTEQRAIQRQWKLRESQIATVQENVCSLFGGLQGIVGESALPAPETLCLEQLIEQ